MTNKHTTGTLASCTCRECTEACEKNPGWFSPEQADKALMAGHAKKMMLDWLDPSSKLSNDEEIWILAPAARGFEARKAPDMDEMQGGSGPFSHLYGDPPYKGRCVFLENGLCSLHDSGFKPTQCCSALHGQQHKGEWKSNYDMARMWNNPEAQKIVAKWKAAVNA